LTELTSITEVVYYFLFATRFTLVTSLAYSLNLKMEEKIHSEASVDFQRTTWRCIPEEKNLQTASVHALNIFFRTPVYLQSVQNTMSKWEETETNGVEESSVALICMEEAQGLEW
jgi:hypothetical protein